MHQLRTGAKSNPNRDLVIKLAEYMEVHPAYFVGGRRDREPESLPTRTFANKLNTLFKLVHPASGDEFTNNHVVVTVRTKGREQQQQGWTISAETLEQYRSGANPNPGLIHILALADVFGAPPAYFFDDELADNIDEQLETRWAMQSFGVEAVIMRANTENLRPSVRTSILNALTAAFKPKPEDGDEDGRQGGT
jgi:transcriptional regulator with XRE-family HTH domain